MFHLPRFFYEDGSNDGSGGNPDGGPATKDQKLVNTNVDVLKPLFSEEEIKGFGFDNVDQLKQHLQKNKENLVPDEVKKKNAEVEKADFLKVSAEEGLMNVDEFTSYEALNKKSDRELVYEKYYTEFKVDNPEATDELIRTEFDSEYKLGDTNEKAKLRGESRLKKEAEEIRSPLTGKFTAAKTFVDNYRLSKKEEPVFIKFIDDLVTELTPETFNIAKAKDETKDDEDEIDIPVKITKEQREEISKLFKNPKYFAAFLENKDKLKETLTPGLTKKITSIIKQNNFDTAISYAFKEGKGIGRKKGSNIGAEQPFGIVRNLKQPVINQSAADELDASDRALRQKHGK
jgi:hypothetical protein